METQANDPGELGQRLGHRFRDPDLLRQALTHPSAVQKPGNDRQHNQRLEFLGDSVLALILSQMLYERFPNGDEGTLTKTRARLVNATSLASRGSALGLGPHLLLSQGEENTGGRDRASALADAFEAVLGAIFLDGGFDAARAFVQREFAADLSGLELHSGIENPKGELQELFQTKTQEAPVYHLVSSEGPDHERIFSCAVMHAGTELARGSGRSKKAAESAAALAALEKLKSG